MNQRHLARVALLATFVVGLGCAGVPTVPAASPKPKAPGKAGAKGSPTPKPSPTPTPTPRPTGTPSTAATTRPTPTPTPTPGPPASAQEVASATDFPFTEAGQRWNYKLSLGVLTFAVPGTLQVTTQAVSSASSDVYSVFDVDTSKVSLGGGSGGKPYHVERLQTLNRADGNPYAKLLSLLFDQSGQGMASSTAPVSTREDATVLGKSYPGAVRQKFDTTIGSTTLKLDMFLTAEDGMVKEVAKGDRLPGGLLPPNPLLGSIDKLPFTLTLELESRETVDPQTLASGTPAASETQTASPTTPASGATTP
jgi:hypothetical protein